jgi:Co/Zn/Cd efflux system component
MALDERSREWTLVGMSMGVLATWQLAKANRQSMNIEGSFQHILTDLIAFIATAIASAVILATDWTRADGVAALFVAAVMLRSAWGLLRDFARVLRAAEGDRAIRLSRGRAGDGHCVVLSVGGFQMISQRCPSGSRK